MTETSDKNSLKSVARLPIAILTCSLLAPGIYGLFGLAFGSVNSDMSPGAIFGPAWLMASGLTLLAVLILGVPAFLLLRSRNAATWLSAVVVGAMVGVLIFVLLGATVLGRFDLRTGASLALTGMVVGPLFRLLARSVSRR